MVMLNQEKGMKNDDLAIKTKRVEGGFHVMKPTIEVFMY